MISDSLFHFTEKIETLEIILDSLRFRSSYCVEKVNDLNNEAYIALPMVCFCDIPLKEYFKENIKENTKEDEDSSRYGRYGKYGIGIKKDNWSEKNKINPILYRRVDSSFSTSHKESLKGLKKMIDFMYRHKIEESHLDYFEKVVLEINSVEEHLHEQANYTKLYEDGGKKYYEAREWRYMPEDRVHSPRRELTKHDTKNYCKEINLKYHKNQPDYLDFDVEEITHLIVDKKEDLDVLINEIEISKKFNRSETLYLIQKLIDVATIKRDL